ncbi:MAG: hypothetical protein WD278_12770 [Pirellulales bacterium]
MNRKPGLLVSNQLGLAALAALGILCPTAAVAQGADRLPSQPALAAPAFDEVRALAMAWLDESKADPAVRERALELWTSSQVGGIAALDALAGTFALADPRAARLLEICRKPRPRGPLAEQDWLAAEDTPPLVRNNLRLVYGRWLAQQGLYDELLAQLSDIKPADVVDPASLLFYQGVAHHRLLNKQEGLAAIGTLLNQVAASPRRFAAVAALMQHDLEALEDESLDHIARRMDDIRRRLELGRAGSKVRKIEDDVIASLDKLIEEMEQQQQQQQSAASSGGSSRPSAPMPDSRLARAAGAGDVNRRDLGDSSGWGDLPARQREEALQQIGKDFPAHYRDAIEQYFRKLASETETPRN